MKLPILAVSALSTLLTVGTAGADDSGNFVIRLGQDTTSVEHFTRSAARLEVSQMGRAPRLLQRRYVYEYAGGKLARFSMVVNPPGSTAATQTINATVEADSFRMKVMNGPTPGQSSAIATPAGTRIAAYSSPWAVYEGEIMQLIQGKQDTARVELYLIGFPRTTWLRLQRMGRDSVELSTGSGDEFHVGIDGAGRIQGVLPIAGTGKFSVERVASLDVDAMAASFAAREKTGAAMGVLSPRDSVKVNAGGASLWIDYGRPGKRGREIFGNVVPLGSVWRAGANAATQFKTDKALDFGGTVVPAGFYTLWVVPGADQWTLLVNSQTGQWGTEHDASKDLFKIAMKLSRLPESAERFTIHVEPAAAGGKLHMEWDTTRATAEFAVKL